VNSLRKESDSAAEKNQLKIRKYIYRGSYKCLVLNISNLSDHYVLICFSASTAKQFGRFGLPAVINGHKEEGHPRVLMMFTHSRFL